MRPDGALHIVSVSIGSTTRDKTVEAEFGGRKVLIERRGTNGDLKAARELMAQLDGKVDAFGMGGTDLYLFAAGRRYTLADSARIASGAKQTPVLDGSGLKRTLEPAAIERLAASGELDLRGKKVLLVSAVDRFGMAEAIAAHTDQFVFGDMMFSMGINYPIRSMKTLARLAKLLLPVICHVPFKYLYPIGEKQNEITPKYRQWYDWADVIAGDFLFIRRFLPLPEGLPLAGKAVLTNTTTAEDVELLRERGLSTLVTTTPVFDGRSFGTNVLEAVLTALAGSRERLSEQAMLQQLEEWGWTPSVTRLETPQ
jgi:hypothetical protein